MEKSAATEPLNFLIIVIYDLLIVFSSPPVEQKPHWPLQGFTSWFYLIDITHIDRICDKAGQQFKYLCNLIGCEAQEGAE